MTEFISKEEYEKRKKHIEDLQKELDQYAVKYEWWETDDTLKLHSTEYGRASLEVEANYGTWQHTKQHYLDSDVLLIDMTNENDCTTYMGLGLGEMIKLRDYLSQKIEYLQSPHLDVPKPEKTKEENLLEYYNELDALDDARYGVFNTLKIWGIDIEGINK